MIDRVFDFARVPCHLRFPDLDGQTVRAPIFRISKSKAIVDHPDFLESDARITVTLQFEDDVELVLDARVEDSGENGLFLTFLHPDQKSEGHLQTLLVEYASRERPEPEPEVVTEPGSKGSLRSTILSRTREVRSTELAAQHQNVRVVNMSTITQLIRQSVEEAVASSERQWEEKERQRLLEETQDAFQERLESFKAENEGLVARTSRLEEQLERARQLLEEERQREVRADQFTVSQAGMHELEQRLERTLRRVATAGGLTGDTEEEIRRAIAGLLDDEREKIREKEEHAHNDKIRLLEHKVGRLAQTLEETSEERDRAKRRAEVLEASAGGVAGIVVLANLEADPYREKKLALLEEIISVNREVREHMNDVPTGPVDRPALTASIAGETVGDQAPTVKKIEVKGASPPPPLECTP